MVNVPFVNWWTNRQRDCLNNHPDDTQCDFREGTTRRRAGPTRSCDAAWLADRLRGRTSRFPRLARSLPTLADCFPTLAQCFPTRPDNLPLGIRTVPTP